MANKWKVSAGEQFLGHYYGKTPEVAAKKAVEACSTTFVVKTGLTAKKCNSNACVTFSAEEVERICNE